MAKCKKCNGIGRVENGRYWNAKAKYNTDWYLQFEPYINCRECKGTGYVLSDVKDATLVKRSKKSFKIKQIHLF